MKKLGLLSYNEVLNEVYLEEGDAWHTGEERSCSGLVDWKAPYVPFLFCEGPGVTVTDENGKQIPLPEQLRGMSYSQKWQTLPPTPVHFFWRI